MTSYITDLAASCLPSRGEKGMLIMLECYLDDSGTHNGSRVLVWGGVSAHKGFFDQFESDWKSLLQNPCTGKPPIKKFHSYDLARSEGEFASYNQAERDATRHDFRKVITDASLTWMSYGVSLDAWEDIVPPEIKKVLTAEDMLFGALVRDVLESAKKFGEPVSFVFDQGRSSYSLVEMVKVATETADAKDSLASYTFAPVVAHAGLQAADMVAHETYMFFSKCMDSKGVDPDPHLERLTQDVFDSRGCFFGEAEIRHAFESSGKI